MKKLLLLMAAAVMTVACTNESSTESREAEPADVTLTFSPYEMERIDTRAATSIADFCTHLDVWIVDGENTIEMHQTTSDADFGTLSVTLDKTKTYTLYAVAHKCTDNATLTGGVISFPEDKVTHSMFYSQTFTPADGTTLTCLMQRIVAVFRMETTDAVPTEVNKIRVSISGTYSRWNVATGATNQIERTSTMTISSTNADGTISANVYAIVTDAQTQHTVTVEALDANDQPTQTARVFENVPMRNGYRTTYRGIFFRELDMTMTFTVDDWNDFDVVNF